MRITSGLHRGRTIKAPSGRTLRPTSDMMRQVIFNMLLKYGLPEGVPVLDAFCGTGALGLEALSRGAASCIFIDQQSAHIAFARANAAALGLKAQCSFIVGDATRLRRNTGAQATLAFLDPPYRQNLIAPALESLAVGGWLASGALCVCESEKEHDIALPGGYTPLDVRCHGGTKLSFVRFLGL